MDEEPHSMSNSLDSLIIMPPPHLERGELIKQTPMSMQSDSSIDRAPRTVSNRKHNLNTDQESAMESGVAQIANIGSVISSTFEVFNCRFAKFDDILGENVRRSDDISGESRNQRQKILFLKKSMDDMQEQMKAIAASVRQIEFQIGSSNGTSLKMIPATVVGSGKEKDYLKERAEILANKLLAEEKAEALKQERNKLTVRITDLEKEMQIVKLKPVDLEVDFSVASKSLSDALVTSVALTDQKDELMRIVSSLDQKINEIEKVPHELRRVFSKPDTELESDDEPIVDIEGKDRRYVNESKFPSTVNSVDFFGNDQLSVESQEMSNSWEPIQPDRSTQRRGNSLLQPLSARDNEFRALIAANSEAMDVMVGTVKHLREEAIRERAKTSSDIETLTRRLAELENAAELNNGNQLAKLRDMNERLIDFQEGSQSGPGSSMVIKRLQLALNDVIAEVDDLKFKGAMHDGEMSSREYHNKGQHQGSQDHLNTASLLLEIEINSVKNKLLGLRDDLDNGLDSYADAHAADPEGSEAFESPFVARVAEFADRLDNVILTFTSKETPEATLIALFHPLDALTIELEALFDLDQQSVASMGITFDDVTSDDSMRNVRDTMRHVWEASLPLLDHRVNKITMRRRLTALEALVRSKADATVVSSFEAELRYMINSKADQKELLAIMSKKVSLGELQRLKDQLMKQIVSIRGFEYSQAGAPNPLLDPQKEGLGEGGLTSAEGQVVISELKHLGRRFDILHSFHEDLVTQCTGYVPREEVEQALRALLGELKIMKCNTITADLLGESLKTKANAAEVQKLVSALTGALGDIGGRNDFASAVYARCLVCDKPVKSLMPSMLAPLSNNRNTRAFSPGRGSTNQYSAGGGYYDKSSDRGSVSLDRPSTMDLAQGSIGSGSMGFAAWNTSHSNPLTPNAHTPSQSSGLTTHSGIIQGIPRATGVFDAITFSAGSSPSASFKGVSKLYSEVSIINTSIDLPPLQSQYPQVPGKVKTTIGLVHGQAGHGRIRAQGVAGGATGPIYALDFK